MSGDGAAGPAPLVPVPSPGQGKRNRLRERQATVLCVADVEREHVDWLWHRRIAFGKVQLLDGDPGLGKSTLTLAIAAAVSTGRGLPDSQRREPAGVVLVSLEDGIGDTIRPRLEAAGADLQRVHVLESVGRDGRSPSIPGDLDVIECVIRENRARLLIVDPLMGALAGNVNAHRDQDVRRALTPLKAMAERTGAAVLVVRHLNKASDLPAMYRGGGSIGITGAARIGLLVARDPDDPADDSPRRVLAEIKNNLSPKAAPLRFSIVASTESPEVPVVAWGETCSLTADQLLARPENDGASGALGEAVAWLRAELEGGARPANELREAAKVAGIAWRTLQRARDRAGVVTRKAGFDGAWLWALDGEDAIAEDLAPSPKAPTAPVCNLADLGEGANELRTRQPASDESAGWIPDGTGHAHGCRCNLHRLASEGTP